MPDTLAHDSPAAGKLLRQGLQALEIEDSDGDLATKLEQYLELLLRWNKAYNLTAVRDAEAMVSRHFLDSLACAPYLRPNMQRVLDVGTGAGLPGIPLALLFPQREFHLLDSNGKKARFLFQVKTELSLDNISVHNQRAESFVPSQRYDAVISRAFASLQDMVECCQHLCLDNGCYLAMKGQYPQSELAAVADKCTLVAAHALDVPGLNEQRHLIELSPHNDSNGEYIG
ncbi:16S rRNA (guanine(527)-N(7))-methyltransferase RsmG [Candidatus Litorirhabdus singularis]|uniref:16S rRNA (guanine(527)-N(7))-methyltransferase RsmG n=1 Tax=Candidatus Litorirhabdus singularis TaxID=2518993 RepID=UPI002430ECDA|nr:16S rRNA (guanine(527)-N(7))-methyltransferase RsmG [Candidatus Litorirhabdus singularis]